MGRIVKYDPSSSLVPGDVTQFLDLVDELNYSGQRNTLINPDISAVDGLNVDYWKVLDGAVVPMETNERVAIDQAIAAAIDSQIRDQAKNSIGGLSPEALIFKAKAAIDIDEQNIIRGWIMSFKAQVALALSLEDFKTRVAGLSDLPDRNLAEMKTAINSKIDTKTMDTNV